MSYDDARCPFDNGFLSHLSKIRRSAARCVVEILSPEKIDRLKSKRYFSHLKRQKVRVRN